MSETGWICPKCRRVFAPFVPTCNLCNGAIGKSPEQITPTAKRIRETRSQFEDRHKDDPLCGYGGHYGY
mgnify:CR=1 FL=1